MGYKNMSSENLQKSGSFIFNNIEINKYINKDNMDLHYYLDNKSFILLRKKMGMTQKNFSVFLGISERVVQRIESKNHIGLNILNRLEKVLGQWKINHN